MKQPGNEFRLKNLTEPPPQHLRNIEISCYSPPQQQQTENEKKNPNKPNNNLKPTPHHPPLNPTHPQSTATDMLTLVL